MTKTLVDKLNVLINFLDILKLPVRFLAIIRRVAQARERSREIAWERDTAKPAISYQQSAISKDRKQ